MCLDRAPGNVELLGDFLIAAPLQQQIDDLLFSCAQAN